MATVDAHGCVFNIPYACIVCIAMYANGMDTYRRGLLVARSDGLGITRASKCGTSYGKESRAFFVYG